jgi:hypothetical protein
MIEVVNLRTCKDWGKPGDVLIDRRTKWGNPFLLKNEKDREMVIEKYRVYFIGNLLIDATKELKDAKRLGCWCSPLPCHGDVIKFYIDAYNSFEEFEEQESIL